MRYTHITCSLGFSYLVEYGNEQQAKDAIERHKRDFPDECTISFGVIELDAEGHRVID